MNPFALLYILYGAKVCSQASIYFIWLVDSSSKTIAFIAAAVAVLAVFPFFHIIVHVFSAQPLSSPSFTAYLCVSLLLAILWFQPTQDGERRVLPFALVTAFDLLDLLIFIFHRKISHWRDALIPDVEQGHPRPYGKHNPSMTQENTDVEQPQRSPASEMPEPSESERRHQTLDELGYNIGALNRAGRPVTSIASDPWSGVIQQSTHALDRGDIAPSVTRSGYAGRLPTIQRSRSAGLNIGTVQPIYDGQEAEIEQEGNRWGASAIHRGVHTIGGPGHETLRRSQTPVTVISSSIHPAFRPTLDSISLQGSLEGSDTPTQHPGYRMPEPYDVNPPPDI